MDTVTKSRERAAPWNKGKLLGQKPPLKLKDIWAIRIRLQLSRRGCELALFNLAIDSKLRGCDLVALRVHDVLQGSRVTSRAIVMQKKTRAACAVRDHGTNARCDCRMGRDGAPEAGAVSLSESVVGIAASFNPAVRSNRWLLGGVNRPGPGGVRHPLAAKDEGDADLSENQEFAGGAAPTRPHQA